jgi:hypothetical protein
MTPTDAEILEIAGLAPNRRVCASTCMTAKFDKKPCKCYPGMHKDEAIHLVRAALAKWGTPTPAGEHAAQICESRARSLSRDGDHAAANEARKCASAIRAKTAPPVREPLTDEYIKSLCAQPWVFDTVKQWVRIVEAAHGITGGQHGTE